MESRRLISRTAATVYLLFASMALSACGTQEGNGPAAMTAPPASTLQTSAEPSLADSIAPSAVVTTAPSPEVPATTAEPEEPALLKTFAFPDGHISFSYPEDWSVRIQRGPGRDGPGLQPAEAVVSDGAGDDLFRVSSGADGVGCTSGPTYRTVLDKAAVPAMRDVEGTVPLFVFTVETTRGQDWYSMTLSHPRYSAEGETSSGCPLLTMGNGASQATVIFSPPPQATFTSRESAQAWMGTEQYARLKSLMLSLAYS